MTDVSVSTGLSGLDQVRSGLDKIEKDLAGLPKSAANASRGLDGFATSTTKASKSVGVLGISVAKLGSLFAGLGLIALGRQVVQTASEFEQLRVRLESVTGSAVRAEQAFTLITKFATRTPFEVKGITEAFIQLQAAGIAPTEARLRNFGDLAAAFGRDITQIAGAVVGAVTGETERLKAFGIIARVEGDKLALNFRGTKQLIERDAESITNALSELAETNFAGGMEKQSRTLAGAFSNLQDKLDAFFDSLGRSGLVDVLTTAIKGLSGAVENLGKSLFPTIADELELIDEKIDAINERRARSLIKGPDLELFNLKARRSELLLQLDITRKREDADVAAAAATNNLATASRTLFKSLADLPAPFQRATAAAVAHEKALAAASKRAQDVIKADQQLANTITKSVLTPLEKYQRELGQLNRLLDQGRITQETYNRAVVQAQDGLTKASDSAKEFAGSADLMLEPFRNAIGGIQDAMTDMFENIFSGGVDTFADLGATLKRMFVRLAAEIATLLVFQPVCGDPPGTHRAEDLF